MRQHYDAVYRFCARRIGPDRAADVSQETFITANRVLKNFRAESAVRTWLLGIANNECRRANRQARCGPSFVELDPMRHGEESHESPAIAQHVLAGALAQLSEDHREVVLLHELEGLTYDEAAEVLGVPVGTVKSRLHHAFLHLRRVLNPQGAPVG